MTLHLHIESLSLEGGNISRSQRPQLQAALEAELARLFTAHGVPKSLHQGGRIPKLPANLTLAGKPGPGELGQAIARSIYTDLNQGGITNGSTTRTVASIPERGAGDNAAVPAGETPGGGELGGEGGGGDISL